LKGKGFYSWEEVRPQFNLENMNQCIWRKLFESIPRIWFEKLMALLKDFNSGDWLKVY
jgi:hypothetical protein